MTRDRKAVLQTQSSRGGGRSPATKAESTAPFGIPGSDHALKVGQAAAALDEARLRQQALGARLRQMFDDVMSEPVPEEFLSILRGAEVDRGSES